MEIKRCPECEKNIPATANRCRCGWVAHTAQSSYIPCAFAGCSTSATLKVRTKTGWAKVCLEHDKKLVGERANEYCLARGLDTMEKKRAWLKKFWKQAPKSLMAEPVDQDEREIAEMPF